MMNCLINLGTITNKSNQTSDIFRPRIGRIWQVGHFHRLGWKVSTLLVHQRPTYLTFLVKKDYFSSGSLVLFFPILSSTRLKSTRCTCVHFVILCSSTFWIIVTSNSHNNFQIVETLFIHSMNGNDKRLKYHNLNKITSLT